MGTYKIASRIILCFALTQSINLGLVKPGKAQTKCNGLNVMLTADGRCVDLSNLGGGPSNYTTVPSESKTVTPVAPDPIIPRESTTSKQSSICPPESNQTLPALSCQIAELQLGSEVLQRASRSSKTAPSASLPQAKRLCMALIPEILKSPASLKFVDSPYVEPTTLRGIYLVNGKLDAQNSYGALLRSSYSCVLKYDNSGFGLVDGNSIWLGNG